MDNNAGLSALTLESNLWEPNQTNILKIAYFTIVWSVKWQFAKHIIVYILNVWMMIYELFVQKCLYIFWGEYMLKLALILQILIKVAMMMNMMMNIFD